MRLILLVILVVLAGLVVWSLLKPPSPPAPRNGGKGDYEPMVRCQRCGVNLPQSQASRDTDGHWRCPAHRHEND